MLCVISIICIAIVLFIVKHLYVRNWISGLKEKARTKIWHWLIIFVLCLIPVVNILFVAFLLWLIIFNSDFSIKNKYTDSIKDFLNKEL